MDINEKTKVLELIGRYPFLEDFLKGYSDKFSVLSNPVVRNTIGRVATLKMAAEMAGIDIIKFIEDVREEIARHKTESDLQRDDKSRQEQLKDIIKDLHSGLPFDEVKKRFDELIKDLDASEIAAMEESLIREGMPVSEVQRLCDLHVNVFKNILNQKPTVTLPESHPLYMYQLENSELQKLLQEIQNLIPDIGKRDDEVKEKLRALLLKLREINYHYLRKENQLFPYLEKYDFTGPSQVMWGIHDEIRKKIRDITELTEIWNTEEIQKLLPGLIVVLGEMIYKEENILFPTALKLLSDKDWEEIKKGEKEIGFSFVGDIFKDKKIEVSDVKGNDADTLNLSTGVLNMQQLDSILRTLPVDLSFVDENDEVRYYSDTKERIFPRSPGVIGRKVQRCHPPKSVHIVEKILDSFRNGVKNVAEFYIKLGGRDIHIRYFAVRNKDGKYLGTLEVSQDITEIRRLDKEKRLLDWE